MRDFPLRCMSVYDVVHRFVISTPASSSARSRAPAGPRTAAAQAFIAGAPRLAHRAVRFPRPEHGLVAPGTADRTHARLRVHVRNYYRRTPVQSAAMSPLPSRGPTRASTRSLHLLRPPLARHANVCDGVVHSVRRRRSTRDLHAGYPYDQPARECASSSSYDAASAKSCARRQRKRLPCCLYPEDTSTQMKNNRRAWRGVSYPLQGPAKA